MKTCFVMSMLTICSAGSMRGHQESVTVTIPIVVEDGMVLKVPGRGKPSEVKAGRPETCT
jgi:hypothetical protein